MKRFFTYILYPIQQWETIFVPIKSFVLLKIVVIKSSCLVGLALVSKQSSINSVFTQILSIDY